MRQVKEEVKDLREYKVDFFVFLYLSFKQKFDQARRKFGSVRFFVMLIYRIGQMEKSYLHKLSDHMRQVKEEVKDLREYKVDFFVFLYLSFKQKFDQARRKFLKKFFKSLPK